MSTRRAFLQAAEEAKEAVPQHVEALRRLVGGWSPCVLPACMRYERAVV